MSQGSIALTVSMISFVGVVIAAVIGWFGVRRSTAPALEVATRQERKDLLDRIDELEEKQDEDRRTIRQQAQLIGQQEERILNQNITIRSQGQRITRLESVLRRNKLPVPNGSDDTGPNAIIT